MHICRQTDENMGWIFDREKKKKNGKKNEPRKGEKNEKKKNPPFASFLWVHTLRKKKKRKNKVEKQKKCCLSERFSWTPTLPCLKRSHREARFEVVLKTRQRSGLARNTVVG